MNVQSLLSTTSLAVNEAAAVMPAVVFFVQEAESTAAPSTTGADKLAAVRTALQAFLTTNSPNLSPKFDAIWTSLTGVIAGLVSLYNSLGVFTHAPAI